MFHGVAFDAGSERLDERRLREVLASVLADQRRVATIIEERTSLNESDAAALLQDTSTRDADWALHATVVHYIEELVIPPGARTISFVFQR